MFLLISALVASQEALFTLIFLVWQRVESLRAISQTVRLILYHFNFAGHALIIACSYTG